MRLIFAFATTIIVVMAMLTVVAPSMGADGNVIHSTTIWITCGAIFLAIIIFILSIHRYRRVEPENALVRLGGGGIKVAIDAGIWYNVITHDIMEIPLNEIPIEIQRQGADALITYDFLSADIECAFLLRVQTQEDSVLQAARSFAREPISEESLREMFEAKFEDALRTVAAQMEMASLLQKREEFTNAVREIASENLLERYGLTIEDIHITKLKRTADYVKLRNFINRRVEFNYDTGVKIVGRLIECLPEDEASDVQLAIMENVDILSDEGETLAHHEKFSLVPNTQVGFSRE